jgi:predicted transcriptional regulator
MKPASERQYRRSPRDGRSYVGVTVYVPVETADALGVIARKRGLNRSAVLREAIDRYVGRAR